MAKRWYYKDENGNKVPVPQYKINSDNHYTKSDADNKFATKESTDTKVAKTDIVQSVGNATDKIMSQKASTDSFIANTPSGDPAHFLYESAGAKWNEDTGLWTLGSYSDLTTEEIRYAFANKVTYINNEAFGLYHDYDCRCMFPLKMYGIGRSIIFNRCLANSKIREFMTDTMNNGCTIQLTGNSAYAFSSKNIVRISSEIDFPNDINTDVRRTIFHNCVKLEYIRLMNTNFGLYLKDSPLLSKESVLSMINRSKNGNTITHTLHPDVYAKCVDGGEWFAEIQTALTNKTNVSLAKGE